MTALELAKQGRNAERRRLARGKANGSPELVAAAEQRLADLTQHQADSASHLALEEFSLLALEDEKGKLEKMLADVDGSEVETWMLENGVVETA